MTRALYLISTVIFIAVMVAVSFFLRWTSNFISSDMAFGIVIGGLVTLGVVAIIRKFEQSSTGSNTPAQE